MRISTELAYNGFYRGYVEGGHYSASFAMKHFLKIKRTVDIESYTFPAHDDSSWYDTFTFTVPDHCLLRITGFEIKYLDRGRVYSEFYPDRSTFVPVARY